MENLFYAKDEKHIRKYAGGGNFTIKNGDYRLDVDHAIYPEFLISYEFDKYLRVSGQIDVLTISDNQVVIRDGCNILIFNGYGGIIMMYI